MDTPKWLTAWRHGIAPCLPVDGLESLRKALAENDEHLIQEDTTSPVQTTMNGCLPVEGACAIGYCGWKNGLKTVDATNRFFSQVLYQANGQLPLGVYACNFVNWFDETPRDEMRRELLPEVELEIARRKNDAVACHLS